MIYNFFDKKLSGSGVIIEIMSYHELAEELHKSIIRNFEKQKIYSPFKNNI